MQKSELAHARGDTDYTYLPHVADSPGAMLEEIEGEAEPWPGILIVPTPGQSHGHQSLVVRRRQDAWCSRGRRSPSHPATRGIATRTTSRSPGSRIGLSGLIARFREFDPWRVYFAHDRAVWQREVAAEIM